MNSKPCIMRVHANQSKYAQKVVFRFSVSKLCFVSLSQQFSFRFSKTRLIYQQFFQKFSFLNTVSFPAFFFKFHYLPPLWKLLVRLRLLSADGTNLSARGPGYRASPNLTACLHGPFSPRLTRHSPGRLASPNLTACLQGPFTVCCARLAHHPSSLRELEVALSLHYRNQYHSSKFSPRIWGGNKSSHHISSHLISQKSHFISPKISFHFKLI